MARGERGRARRRRGRVVHHRAAAERRARPVDGRRRARAADPRGERAAQLRRRGPRRLRGRDEVPLGGARRPRRRGSHADDRRRRRVRRGLRGEQRHLRRLRRYARLPVQTPRRRAGIDAEAPRRDAPAASSARPRPRAPRPFGPRPRAVPSRAQIAHTKRHAADDELFFDTCRTRFDVREVPAEAVMGEYRGKTTIVELEWRGPRRPGGGGRSVGLTIADL